VSITEHKEPAWHNKSLHRISTGTSDVTIVILEVLGLTTC